MSQRPQAAPRAGLRLMHVHAHPDDESSKGAASTAMYVAEGVDVHVATCTGGERGSILNPKMDRPDVLENITEIRRQEMERARDILGVRQDWLGFVDSGWPEGDPKPPLPEGCFALVPLEEAAAPLVRLIREFRPHVADDVRRARRLPAPRPHQVPRDLASRRSRRPPTRSATPSWASRGRRSSSTTTTRSTGRGCRRCTTRCSPTAWSRRGRSGSRSGSRSPSGTPGSPPGCRARDYFGVRDQALLAHATQIDPDGFWFAIPREIQARSGRPRTSSWSMSHVDDRDPRGRPVRRHHRPAPERLPP